ncbi:MAG: class I SAM-dependent methyltransferase [Nitrospira sp.]|nr:class I SAM-dependent methyltransferase [Nitrospira sp.]
MWRLSSGIPFGGRLKGLVQQHRLQTWRHQITSLLRRMDRGEGVTVCELLNSYFPNKGQYNYFAYRFSQPRHLVALSLVTLIDKPQRPILDFCCGQGHITRSLVQHSNQQQVIGVDKSLWNLYVAKRWIASEGEYVCCSVENALPFVENAFSVVYCSDAFHYVVNKFACIQELRRSTDEGTMILTWIHNKHIRMPHDGVPLSPEGYHALFRELPHRIVADEDILNRYLRKEGPPLATQPETEYLNHKPVLSIIASSQEDRFYDRGTFVDWPHGKGRLGLNPLYIIEAGEGVSGKVSLHRRFPSRSFEEDNAEYKHSCRKQWRLIPELCTI